MSNNKKLRKQKYRTFIIETDGFIIEIKDRGECANYEDKFCVARFEISGGLNDIYNLRLSPKDKNYVVSQDDIKRVKANCEKKMRIK